MDTICDECLDHWLIETKHPHGSTWDVEFLYVNQSGDLYTARRAQVVGDAHKWMAAHPLNG